MTLRLNYIFFLPPENYYWLDLKTKSTVHHWFNLSFLVTMRKSFPKKLPTNFFQNYFDLTFESFIKLFLGDKDYKRQSVHSEFCADARTFHFVSINFLGLKCVWKINVFEKELSKFLQMKATKLCSDNPQTVVENDNLTATCLFFFW